MTNPDFHNQFLRTDTVTYCPNCGSRTQLLVDFSHLVSEIQIHQCLDEECGFEFVEVEDEDATEPF